MTVVPLTVHFGDEEYVDGATITHKMFYEKLIESDVLLQLHFSKNNQLVKG